MEHSSRFLFCRNLKKISIIQHKKEQKSARCRERANVATLLQQISNVATLCGESLDTMTMSRHHKQLHQSNNGSYPMSRHHTNMATTLLAVGKTELFKCRNIKTMSGH